MCPRGLRRRCQTIPRSSITRLINKFSRGLPVVLDKAHAMTIAVALMCSWALAAGPETKISVADNAALQYWQAFGIMPAWEELSADERNKIDNWQTAPLDRLTSVHEMLYRRALGYFPRATAKATCEWGLREVLKEQGPAGIP